jgi:hypothetical protein
MATIDHVRPGAVISSDFFNQLIDRINELETRLGTVEQGGGGAATSIIDHFDPPVQVAVGQVLTLFGTFDFPPSANLVSFDGVPITTFRAGSNNLQLLFLVPPVTVPPGGRNATIHIATTKGTDDKSYRVLPAVASNVPAPQIGTVVDVNSGATTLITGQAARITGLNFAANPTDNIIKLTVGSGLNKVVYPKQGQTIAINAAQTNATQIVFTVPVIAEIGVLTSAPVVLEVGVGSATPDTKSVTVFRAS